MMSNKIIKFIWFILRTIGCWFEYIFLVVKYFLEDVFHKLFKKKKIRKKKRK